MNWQEIKERIYHENGSLRDIYIRKVTPDDWKRWIDFVNKNYRIDFKIGNTLKGDKIEYDVIAAYWNDPGQECPSAAIHLDNVIIKAYFFDENEIEHDITPIEIKSLKDHESLLEYLKSVSALLNRPVELTQENPRESKDVLMTVDERRATFPNQ